MGGKRWDINIIMKNEWIKNEEEELKIVLVSVVCNVCMTQKN